MLHREFLYLRTKTKTNKRTKHKNQIRKEIITVLNGYKQTNESPAEKLRGIRLSVFIKH